MSWRIDSAQLLNTSMCATRPPHVDATRTDTMGSMRRVLLAMIACVGACTGSKPVPSDAVKCIGNMKSPVYNPCNTEHDCMSGMCQAFPAVSLQVCTQGCDATTPCPIDGTGAAGTCTNGLCQPAQANPCTP